eukprot:9992080-Ditylum_brightwellii.AAC.1
MSNEKGFADADDEQNKKRKNGGQDGGNKQKQHKKQKFNHLSSNDQKDWDLYCGVPDSEACPKRGPSHTSGKCNHNPFKKKGRGQHKGKMGGGYHSPCGQGGYY